MTCRATRIGRAFVAMLTWWIAAGVQAQTPAPLPNPPNLSLVTNGWVKAMVRQADGGVIIGGSFTSVNGYGRGNLARLLPDGSLDPAWNPSADDEVRSLAVDPASGAIYVGGHFSVIGARNRARIAKLSGSGTGAVDATWNPSADGGVYALAVNGAGDVYACGYFNNVGTQARKVFAKLSGTGAGAAYAAWNATANGNYCNAMALDSNGDLFVSGDFTSIGAQARAGLAKLPAAGNGVADATWDPNPVENGPYLPYVAALATDGAGMLYASGNFTSIGGQTRDGLAKLSTTGMGEADATWNPGNCCVYGVHVGADGKIYVGGGFYSVGGITRPRLARLSPSGTGAADASWAPTMDSAYGASFKLLADASGNAYVASSFSDISGQRRFSLAKVDATGAVIGPATDVEAPGTVKAIARQPGGGTIVGGSFLKAAGAARTNLLRLNADGSLDPQWAPAQKDPVSALAVAANSDVYAASIFIKKYVGTGTGTAYAPPDWYLSWNSGVEILAMTTDSLGRLYVGGDFYQVNGESRSNLVRLNPNDTVDLNWNPAPTGVVRALALDGSGNLVVGGNFTYVGGAWRDYVARVSTVSGAADPAWDPSANSVVRALAIDASGDVFAGGSFNYIGGAARCNLARLGAGNGLVVPGWMAGTGCSLVAVSALAIDGYGALYANGSFTGTSGVVVSDLAKLSAGNGALDTAWKPAPDAAVNAIAIDAAAHVITGGKFNRIGGQLRSALAILPGDADVIFRNGFEIPP